jgi:hypothetical protein
MTPDVAHYPSDTYTLIGDVITVIDNDSPLIGDVFSVIDDDSSVIEDDSPLSGPL